MNSTPFGGEHGHFAIVEEHDVAGVAEDRRHVRRDEIFAVADADDDRRAVADGDELFGIVGRHQHQREQPAHALHRAQHRVLEAVVLPFLLDQVRDDFGVGFRLELVSLGDQLALDLEIVLDDAVVDDDDAAGAVAMRMRVFFGRPAVRGPSRVAEAIDAGERLRLDRVFEIDQLAGAAAYFDRAVLRRRRRRPSRSRDIRGFRRPSSRTGTTGFGPMYPTIPHISVFAFELPCASRPSRPCFPGGRGRSRARPPARPP